jgi:hypothetical protein
MTNDFFSSIYDIFDEYFLFLNRVDALVSDGHGVGDCRCISVPKSRVVVRGRQSSWAVIRRDGQMT